MRLKDSHNEQVTGAVVVFAWSSATCDDGTAGMGAALVALFQDGICTLPFMRVNPRISPRHRSVVLNFKTCHETGVYKVLSFCFHAEFASVSIGHISPAEAGD